MTERLTVSLSPPDRSSTVSKRGDPLFMCRMPLPLPLPSLCPSPFPLRGIKKATKWAFLWLLFFSDPSAKRKHPASLLPEHYHLPLASRLPLVAHCLTPVREVSLFQILELCMTQAQKAGRGKSGRPAWGPTGKRGSWQS